MGYPTRYLTNQLDQSSYGITVMKKNFSLTIVTTIILVIATIIIAFFMAYDRTLKSKFDQELFLLIFQFLLTIILAGLGILAFRVFTIERDLRAARRADLDFVYQELMDAQLQILQTIHCLRARIGFERGSDSFKENVVQSSFYEPALETFLRCQLIFRKNSGRVRDSLLGYAQASQLADHLRLIDGAFEPLIEEYEAEATNVRENQYAIKVKDLPEFADFISLSSQSHPFAGQSLRVFENTIQGLCKARHYWEARA